LTASSALGYRDAMRSPALDDVTAELVGNALDAADPAHAREALLETLRRAWRADHAVLARAADDRAAAVVHAVPGGAPAVDPASLTPAFGADAAVAIDPVAGRGFILAVGLRPLDDHRWSVALVRASTAWTSAEQEALGALRPHLELLLEHALLRAALERAREREQAAATEHERLLSVISHELRNPLAPILMWTSTLRRLRGEDPEVQRATTAIANAVNLERHLLEELLDLSRLERGTITPVMERVDLRDVVRQVVDAHARATADARLTVDADLPADPVPVRGDAVRLAEILAAVLENAIKFTSAGGRIAVAVGRRGDDVELSVADSGTGFPSDVLPRLFTPFVQGPNARGGLGVGLAVAQRLLALQHGTITANNTSDGGATVVVALPLATD
jgi:signal transduction histidine kinase